MRPIKLTMSAFLSYAGTTEINMEQLGENGLYLITGDTGAGKTTIFDAICFALYGTASGENREAAMLRSKYAAPDQKTEVTLVFRHKGKEYTVKRNPEYMRPKANGSGMTKETAKAEFWRPDGQVITGTKEVSKAVVEVLSVTKEQFAQISMLAQGDFLKLLLADTKKRQEIFRDLFHTERYQLLQIRLSEESLSEGRACDDLRRSVSQYISGISTEEPDLLLEEVKQGNVPWTEVFEITEKLLSHAEEKESEITEHNASVDELLEKVQTELGKAEAVQKVANDLFKAKKDLEEALPKEQQLLKCLMSATAELKKKEVYQEQIAKISAELESYVKLDELLFSTEEAEKQLKREEKLISSGEAEIIKIETGITENKAELSGLSNAGGEREKRKSEKELLQKKAEELLRLQKDISEAEKKQEEYEAAVERYKVLSREYEEKKQISEVTEKAYFDGQAGLLATGLTEGKPCPVCGSLVHPKPAVCSFEIPTKEKLDRDRKVTVESRERMEESSKETGVLKNSCELMQKNALLSAGKLFIEGDFAHLAKMILVEQKKNKEELSACVHALSEEEKKLLRKEELEKQIPKDEESLKQKAEQLGKTKEEYTGKRAKLTADTEKREELRKQLSFRNGEEAKGKQSELLLLCENLEKAFQKADADCRAQKELISVIKGKIEAGEKTLRTEQHAETEILKEQREKLLSEKKLGQERLQKVRTEITTNKKCIQNIRVKERELREHEERYRFIKTLSDTANGKLTGKEKLMLETYVQTAYFEKIIRRANLRLLKMSGAQYELKRMSEAENNRSQSGLELCVVDHYNGTERSVKTLSGGESFMASLSLALGLSDEVQSCAGGIKVDTMFVDEGFGSLDPEALDSAYRALSSLTEGNRLVGIISHVTELKEKIEKQIIVKKEKTGGSTVRLQI